MIISDDRELLALRLWRKLSEAQKRAWITGIEAHANGTSFEDAMVIALTEQGWPAVEARARVAEAMAR
jgi:hypothetical protein